VFRSTIKRKNPKHKSLNNTFKQVRLKAEKYLRIVPANKFKNLETRNVLDYLSYRREPYCLEIYDLD